MAEEKKDYLAEYTQKIVTLRDQADKLQEDNPGALMQKIKLLAECQTYIGRVSSIVDGDYKRLYAQRKYEHAVAHKNAVKDKAATAEIEIRKLRVQEADLYQSMNRWRNAFSSTTEELHSLKLKMRIDFHDGNGSQSMQRTTA